MLLVVAMLTNVAIAGGDVTGSDTATLADLGDKTATYQVQNDHGAVTVTCSPSASAATSTLSWVLQGADAKAAAAALKATATKSGVNGTFGVTASAELDKLSSKEVSLVVTLPLGAVLNVVGGDGKVDVTACEGSLDLKNTGGDIKIDAPAATLKIVAPTGNVDIRMADGSLTGASTIDAPVGNIAVSMPKFNANISGTAQSIAVSMPKFTATTQTATAVAGKADAGGALMTLSAPKGSLTLK
jgi:hypothetical protein